MASEFLSFATGVGANVESQADWAADPVVVNGFSAGIARSPALNKAWRQSSFVASVMTQWMSQIITHDVLDDGDELAFWSQFWQSILAGDVFDDSGTASAMLIAPPAGLTFPVPFFGLAINVRMAATTTGATTLNWMGHTDSVIYPNAAAVAAGDLLMDSIVRLVFDGVNWQCISASPAIIARFSAAALLPINVATQITGLLQMNHAPVRLLFVSATPGVHSFTPADNNFYLGYATGSGGGGAGTGTAFTGGGGGAGGTAFGWAPCTIGTPVSVTVGTGGAAGLAGGSSDGGNGATTSIGATHTATGGDGGHSVSDAAGGNPGYGSLAGSGFILYGGHGGDGQPIASNFGAGNGGTSYWGGGSRGSTTGDFVTAPPGAGGGGGYDGGGGSPGSDGMVIIWG